VSTSSFSRALSYFVFALSVAAGAQTPAVPRLGAIPTQIPGQNAILMGTDWYPEQWPESRWEDDLRLMEAADLKVVRLA
jgi:beta-galactosidase